MGREQESKPAALFFSTSLSDAEFAAIAKRVREWTGISLSPEKKALVVSRLSRRLRELGIPSFRTYLQHLDTDADEVDRFIDLMTTNETHFFREGHHFQILAGWARERCREPLTIWSAAASTGEEAYTIAMVLAEECGVTAPWSVVATDIALKVLAIGERGRYPIERAKEIPPHYLKRYFLRGVGNQTGWMRVVEALRQKVRWQRLNLVEFDPQRMGRFDAVFLRNVLIYFDPPTKAEVVRRVLTTLKEGGMLFLGHAETLTPGDFPLQSVAPTVYRKCLSAE
ncbi:MAG: protein-glutamate O-methyltransferase CheR [Hydrogenophilus sp.]|nr:protein-glutamate O-methyltransferase CheR [Hydrogenophilus sp.]